jgi:hypothetical protein
VVAIAAPPPVRVAHGQYELGIGVAPVELLVEQDPRPVLERIEPVRDREDALQVAVLQVIDQIKILALVLVAENLETGAKRRRAGLGPTNAEDFHHEYPEAVIVSAGI